jgi:hypothetical protein
MTQVARRCVLVVGLVAAGWGGLVDAAEAVVGRPATPVSYAGVARRSTVGVGAPGVGVTPGIGAGAPGVGVTPAVGVNGGGPVNRAGVRR